MPVLWWGDGVTTGTPYRDAYLRRIVEGGAYTELWTVDGEGRYLWNEAIRAVDAKHSEPPPQRLQCEECREYDLLRWEPRTRATLIVSGLCFTCEHWMRLAQGQGRPKVAIINGKHYMIGPEDASGMRGFGGQRFRILFKDGRSVTTTNLWHQGEIPEHFRERMPDNARWVERGE